MASITLEFDAILFDMVSLFFLLAVALVGQELTEGREGKLSLDSELAGEIAAQADFLHFSCKDGTLISSVDAVNSCREDFAAENGLDSEGYHHCRVSTSRKGRFSSRPISFPPLHSNVKAHFSSCTSSTSFSALPDPYLMGAERLNVPISRCSYGASPLAPFLFVSLISSLFALLVAGIVVEDAPAGALAGLAAGATILAVGTKSRSRSPYIFFFSSDYICSSSFFRELIPFPCSGAQVNPDYYVDDLTQSVLYLLNDSRPNLRSSRPIATDACVPFPLNPPPESPPNGRMGNTSLPSTQRTDDAYSAYSCG